MGYIRDDGLVVVVGPSDCMVSAGTWADSYAGGQWSYQRAAAAAPFYLAVFAKLLQHEESQRGSCLKSIDLYYELNTALLTSLAATIYLVTYPADGAAFADPVSQAFSYDAGHDAAGERVTEAYHKMTLTLTTPIWIAADELVQVQILASAPAGTKFSWYGAAFHFSLRL